jgi:MFS family permease
VSYLLSLVCAFFVCFFGGLNASSSQGLNLEQLPSLRGSMMSLVSAFGNIGYTVSLAICGFVLVLYDWRYLGGVVMVFSLLGLLILNYFAIEP